MVKLREGPLRVLVFGSGSAAFLGAVRSLGRRGHVVFGAWGDATEEEFGRSAEARSRYLAGRIPIPRPWQTGWVDALLNTIQEQRIDVLIPGDDASLVAIDQHRELLADHVVLAMPPREALHIVSDKIRANALARAAGVPVASGSVVDATTFSEAAFADAEFPLLVKPQSSRLLAQLDQRQTVRRVDTLPELTAAVRELLVQSARVEIQTFFRGKGVGVSLLLHGGREHLAFQHLRLHEPMAGGGSSYRIGTAMHEGMHDGAVRMLREAAFDGIAMVEFKWNPATDAYVFIEINPRFWGAMPLALVSGADFPAVWLDVMRGHADPARRSPRIGLRSRRIESDIRWLSQNLRANRSDPTLNRVPLMEVVREATLSILSGKERWDVLVSDDVGPAIGEVIGLMRWFGGAARKRLGQVASRMLPYRLWHRQAIRRRLSSAHRILVVCKGNICRSPYLAHLLADSYDVRQGGFLQRPGRTSPSDAIAVAADRGVSLAAHRSFGLTTEDLAWADVIVVFDAQGVAAVRQLSPAVADRIVLAGEVLAAGPVEVDDPFGQGGEAFTACYSHLDQIATAMRNARRRSRPTP